jgi:hypothetical protein
MRPRLHPNEAFDSLPDSVRQWAFKEMALFLMARGQAPDVVSYWNSIVEEDRWRIIAYVIFKTTSKSKKQRSPIAVPKIEAETRSEMFNLSDLVVLDQWDLYPHAAWFCPTGWGKDYNTSGLLAKHAEGRITACLIKQPEIWKERCPQAEVVWNGYDCSKIEAVLKEAVEANERRVLGQEKPTPWTIVLSDYPSIARGIRDITDRYIGVILRDGRSNRIRLWFLLQESNVAALKMEGRSELLCNINFVRGGRFALDHAAALVKNRLFAPSSYQILVSSNRPCMVDDFLSKTEETC